MRIRTVKPEFFKHEGLFDLEHETGLPIRVAFIGLWCLADRRGRFRWRVRTIKTELLPYDDIEFSRVLHALCTRGFIRKYEVNGEDFGWIPTFERHQIINNRESESDLPERVDFIEDAHACLTREVHARARLSPLRAGEEGEGEGEEEREREGKEDIESGVPDSHPKKKFGGEKKSTPQKKGREVVSSRFDQFWESYPRRVGKDEALKAWKKIKPDDDLAQDIIESVEAQKEGQLSEKLHEKKYIPHPATWLNQGRWQDEVEYDETAQDEGASVFNLTDAEIREKMDASGLENDPICQVVELPNGKLGFERIYPEKSQS